MAIKEEDLVFYIGSLIYPKEMIAFYHQNPNKKGKVSKIYNFLYKFSLERL